MKCKTIDGKQGIKTCLCAHRFEGEQNYHTDSPTCSREGICIFLLLVAS